MAAKILVVDDDPNVQRLLQYTLKQEGYDVVSAVDGAEGFRLWGAELPDMIRGYEHVKLDNVKRFREAAQPLVAKVTQPA